MPHCRALEALGPVALEITKSAECLFLDINECEMFRNLCVNGRCENVFGMFRCICNKGFELDDTGGNCTGIGTVMFISKNLWASNKCFT